MNPFLYPKARHRRRQSPPSFSDYRRYKAYLQMEFERQCVYCRLPDTMGHEFGVDHYRPASRFPESACDYGNLYYAYNACNRRKGAYWPTRNQHQTGCFVPNPVITSCSSICATCVRTCTRTRPPAGSRSICST